MPVFMFRSSPRSQFSWREMSLDFKLLFVWHGCMMVLFIAGERFTTSQELTFAAILMTVLLSIALRHRRAHDWRWPGIESKQIWQAGGGLLLVSIFLYAATPLFPPTKPQALPWYLAGFGIGAMNLLTTLRLARTYESEFQADCQAAAPQPFAAEQATVVNLASIPGEPAWHGRVRTAYTVAFLLVWLNFVAFFYFSGKDFRDGTPAPTATHTEAMSEHGHKVYVTREQKARDKLLLMISMIGMPSVIASGLIFHYLVGVKIFDNLRPRSERLGLFSSKTAR